MENAYKALLMVASIILGLILLSTLMYVLKMGANVNKAYDETQSNYQTLAYNYQFEVYQRDDNSVLDLVTLFNLAYSANADNNYDLKNSITIEAQIGNKLYRVPKYTSLEITDPATFYNKNNNQSENPLKRNQIFDLQTRDNIEVYDLLNETIKDLNISGANLELNDKLSKIHIGDYVYYPDRLATDPDAGKPAIGSGGTTYKYVFNCVDEGADAIKYNGVTGKITYMKFICELNPDWELKSAGKNENWD